MRPHECVRIGCFDTKFKPTGSCAGGRLSGAKRSKLWRRTKSMPLVREAYDYSPKVNWSEVAEIKKTRGNSNSFQMKEFKKRKKCIPSPRE